MHACDMKLLGYRCRSAFAQSGNVMMPCAAHRRHSQAMHAVFLLHCSVLLWQHHASLWQQSQLQTDIQSTLLWLQVFYAMCQGLLYAFCYHLDDLLSRPEPDVESNAHQLQNVHLSDAASPSTLPQSQGCMHPNDIRQALSHLLPVILRHRCTSASGPLLCCATRTLPYAVWLTGALRCLSCFVSLPGTAVRPRLALLILRLHSPFEHL